MKVRDPELVREVEDLLEKAVFQEAANTVWSNFQDAIQTLDEESQHVLELHLNGMPVKDICQKLDLSEDELKTWLQKCKRTVIQQLGHKTKVRH